MYIIYFSVVVIIIENFFNGNYGSVFIVYR